MQSGSYFPLSSGTNLLVTYLSKMTLAAAIVAPYVFIPIHRNLRDHNTPNFGLKQKRNHVKANERKISSFCFGVYLTMLQLIGVIYHPLAVQPMSKSIQPGFIRDVRAGYNAVYRPSV